MSEGKMPSAVAIRRTLEDEVLHGRLLPGQRIDENGLAERFEVSRTPVREALQQLAASGLIELRGRQGAIISQLSVSDLLDAFQVVAELEGFCARLAARRMSRSQHQELRDLHALCISEVEKDDPLGFYDANKQFHELIYTGSNNRFLQEEIRRIRLLVAPYRRVITFQPGRMRESLDEHAEVMEAIFQGDGERADAAMRDHVSLLGDRFTDFVSVLQHNSEPEPTPSG